MENIVKERPSAELERRAVPSFLAPGILRRVSWGAVFAGSFVAFAAGISLEILNEGVILNQVPVPGYGLGSGIWFCIVTILALFAGGLASGRLAGVPRDVDGALHGVLTYSLVTMASFFLLSTTSIARYFGPRSIIGQDLLIGIHFPAAAVWTFVALVLGVIAAAFGGMLGSPIDPRQKKTGL
jgi:hypothetical protein